MGCDSHPNIEVRNSAGKWKVVDSKTRCYDKLNFERDGKSAWDVWDKEHNTALNKLLGSRNYTLFSVIADVRNGEGIHPLFADRGLPEDVSQEVANDIPYDCDYHSHTYFTLRELMEVDWDEVAQEHGESFLYADQYADYIETGKIPDDALDWCPNYKNCREVSAQEMTLLLVTNDPRKLVRMCNSYRTGPYVVVAGQRSYRAIAPELLDVIEELKKLGPPDDVRVVIAFDN